jgi:hypothetical protein
VTSEPTPRLTDVSLPPTDEVPEAADPAPRAPRVRPGFMVFVLVVALTLTGLAATYRASAVRDRDTANRGLTDAQLQLDAARKGSDAAQANLAAQRSGLRQARVVADRAGASAATLIARSRAALQAADAVRATGERAAAAAAAMERALRDGDIARYNELSTAYNEEFGPLPSTYATQLQTLERLVDALAP